jgi:hypothetical protein
MYMKAKSQRNNRVSIETLALFSSGVWDGSRDGLLGAARWGFDSPHVHSILEILPARGCTRTRGMSSVMGQGQGWKPAVILALSPRESKGQSDDVSQLQN